MKLYDCNFGDFITITKTYGKEVVSKQVKFICIFNYYNNFYKEDNRGTELFFIVGLSENVIILRRDMSIEIDETTKIEYSTKEEKQILFNALTERYKNENEDALKYFTDSTYFEILSWLNNYLKIDENIFDEDEDDNIIYPEFLLEARNEIFNNLEKEIMGKFDPKTLKPYDKVLTRNRDTESWECDLFGRCIKWPLNDEVMGYKYITLRGIYKYCIPFNKDTEELHGNCRKPIPFYCNIIAEYITDE